VREAIEAVGSQILYLPPDSPDLNPIKLAFSKLRRLLRCAPRDDRMGDSASTDWAVLDSLFACGSRAMAGTLCTNPTQKQITEVENSSGPQH